MNKPEIIANMICGETVKFIGLHSRIVAEFAESYISNEMKPFNLFPEMAELICALDSWRMNIAHVPSPFLGFWYGPLSSARDVAKMLRNDWPFVYRCPEAYDLLAILVQCHDETCKSYTDDILTKIEQVVNAPGDSSSFDGTIEGLDGDAYVWNHTATELSDMVRARREEYLRMSPKELLAENARLDLAYKDFDNHELCDFYISFFLYDFRRSLLKETFADSGLIGEPDARPQFLS